MIISVLLILISLQVLFQNTPQRFLAAFLFVFITISFDQLYRNPPSETWKHAFMYYGIAASLDYLIIKALNCISSPPKMIKHLKQICLISMALNAYGYFCWLLVDEGMLNRWVFDAYNYAFVIVYALAAIILYKQDKNNVGSFTLHSWRSVVHLNWGRSFLFSARRPART